MTRLLIPFLLIAIFSTCSNYYSQKQTVTRDGITDSITTSERSRVANAFELENDSSFYAWHGGDVIWLNFSKGEVDFPFSASCGILLPTLIVSDKRIIFFWDYSKLSCTYDIGLRKTFGLTHIPVENEPFGEFILVNDTLLKVNYYYPEWVKRIKEYLDTDVFPNQFVLDPRRFNNETE